MMWNADLTQSSGRPKLVEGPSSFSTVEKERQGFDKLSPNGCIERGSVTLA